jgi:DNA repair exonuclease SbcCD ATPase subunit
VYYQLGESYLKILKVVVENFKLFVKLQVPENNSSMGEGLFLICGDNSMGKTSFIESVLWGLLGDSLMDVQKKEMLVRTGQSSCKVDILFDLGGSQYRIIRKLVLKKTKVMKNQLDFNPEAVLSKKEGDKFVPVI